MSQNNFTHTLSISIIISKSISIDFLSLLLVSIYQSFSLIRKKPILLSLLKFLQRKFINMRLQNAFVKEQYSYNFNFA